MFNKERRAPLAHDTSPSISSAVSQQGFHTPMEEDLPTIASRPNSYLQPPTPTSAIMTVSLEGYLEPQRISFGSPPMSHRPFSFDESCQPFSPPAYGSVVPAHRRQSSLGYYPLHWFNGASAAAVSPRRSMSISSHHTCIVIHHIFSEFGTSCLALAMRRYACQHVNTGRLPRCDRM